MVFAPPFHLLSVEGSLVDVWTKAMLPIGQQKKAAGVELQQIWIPFLEPVPWRVSLGLVNATIKTATW
jgi:hypothetical protein